MPALPLEKNGRIVMKYDFYACGPMEGYKNQNKEMFSLVVRLLREKGFTVWSPSENGDYSDSSYSQCMTVDINKVVNDCDGIALLPGWRRSLGGNAEAFVAFICGKEGVEVKLNEDKTDIELVPVDLGIYCLPYVNMHFETEIARRDHKAHLRRLMDKG